MQGVCVDTACVLAHLHFSDQWRRRQREPHMRSRAVMNEASRSALRFERAGGGREGGRDNGLKLWSMAIRLT